MSNVFVIIEICYVHNQWYDISCATLYVQKCILAFTQSTSYILEYYALLGYYAASSGNFLPRFRILDP